MPSTLAPGKHRAQRAETLGQRFEFVRRLTSACGRLHLGRWAIETASINYRVVYVLEGNAIRRSAIRYRASGISLSGVTWTPHGS